MYTAVEEGCGCPDLFRNKSYQTAFVQVLPVRLLFYSVGCEKCPRSGSNKTRSSTSTRHNLLFPRAMIAAEVSSLQSCNTECAREGVFLRTKKGKVAVRSAAVISVSQEEEKKLQKFRGEVDRRVAIEHVPIYLLGICLASSRLLGGGRSKFLCMFVCTQRFLVQST